MQELLGRLRALDPDASVGLRVIACFDELMSGGVGSQGMLSAAAALAGRPVALRRGAEVRVVGPDGLARSDIGSPAVRDVIDADGEVWVVDDGSGIRMHDALILERLALALRIRFEGSSATPTRRDLALLLDDDTPSVDRRAARERLGLVTTRRYRVVAAPIFATWSAHPGGVEDVLPSSDGPLHVLVVAEEVEPDASPVGVGIAVHPDDLALSLRTARIALLLHDGASRAPSAADDLGGLVELLAELPARGGRPERDAEALGTVMNSGWGPVTAEALVRTSSVREAARRAGVHHSTMAQRLESISAAIGFDPLDGLGRTRFGLAWLLWRLEHSRVLELPTAGVRG